MHGDGMSDADSRRQRRYPCLSASTVTVWSTTSSSRGGWWTWRRRSCSSHTPAGVITTPCQPREARKPQQGGELGQCAPHARDRGGRAPAVVSAKACAPLAGVGRRGLARLGVAVVEDGPEGRLDLGLGMLGHPRGRLRQRWIRQRCRGRLERTSSTALRSPSFQASNSSLIAWQMRATVDLDSAASGPAPRPVRPPRPARSSHPRTPPAPVTPAHWCVTPRPAGARQRLGGAARLGPLQHHRAGGRLDVQVGVRPAPAPGPGPGWRRTAHRSGCGSAHRRYSCWHGPRPPPGVGAHGSPRPFHFPPDLDATAAFEEIRRLVSPVTGSWAYSSAELEAPDRLATTGT